MEFVAAGQAFNRSSICALLNLELPIILVYHHIGYSVGKGLLVRTLVRHEFLITIAIIVSPITLGICCVCVRGAVGTWVASLLSVEERHNPTPHVIL